LDLQDKILVSSIPIETYPGVYACCPSAKASTPKRVISSCFDSQRPIERLPSNQPFFHITPIKNLTFKGEKLLGDVEDEEDDSKVVYEVTYIGTPELVIAQDNEPLKTYGLVYLTEDGDVMKVDGNASIKSEDSYFESLLLLLEMKKRGTVYIPELVNKCLDSLFEEVEGKKPVEGKTPKVYTKDTLAKHVIKYIKDNHGANASIHSLLSILDRKFGDTYSAGVFQHQIDQLTRMTGPVCLMPPRMSSFAPREKYRIKPNEKLPPFRTHTLNEPVASQNKLENGLNNGYNPFESTQPLEFSQSSQASQANEFLAPAPLAPAPLAPAPRSRRTTVTEPEPAPSRSRQAKKI
jgi:hypothetical protein